MPLLNHFAPPLYPVRSWGSFYVQLAAAITDSLNATLLPSEYFAEVRIHIGSRVEFATSAAKREGIIQGNEGGDPSTSARAACPWVAPAVAVEMPAIFPDSVEVQVFNTESGLTLVGAVELVSPGNKDRPETRRGFAAKCATYLQQGVGLTVVDIITNRRANLHDELVELLGVGEQYRLKLEPLYSVAYRPVRQPDVEKIQVWTASLAVGQALPIMPLALDKGLIVPVDLDATYTEACQRSRLP